MMVRSVPSISASAGSSWPGPQHGTIVADTDDNAGRLAFADEIAPDQLEFIHDPVR